MTDETELIATEITRVLVIRSDVKKNEQKMIDAFTANSLRRIGVVTVQPLAEAALAKNLCRLLLDICRSAISRAFPFQYADSQFAP